MTIDLKYYLAVLLRRLHYVVLVFAAVTAAAITVAIKLPPVYESSATLLLASSQIPNSLATPTVDTAALEQLQVLQQQLMTRPNLLDIARKLNVFPKIGQMTPDDIVTAMAKATTIDIHTGQNQAALMTITFDADRAQTSADVVNEYVTRILSDNLSMRTTQAQSTLQFFKQQVDRLQGDLSTQSAKIVAFQNAHVDALPSTLHTRLLEQSALQNDLATIAQNISSLQDQKQRLVELYRATGQIAGTNSTTNTMTPEAQLLAQARSDLAQALAVFAPDNPKVKMLEARVAQLKAAVKNQPASNDGNQTAGGAPQSVLDIQIADIDSHIKQLAAQQVEVQKKIAALQNSIDRTPAVSVQLDALKRDYANIQSQYNAASDRLAAASTGAQIEELSKGQKIVVLDAAAVPDKPTKPHRIKLAIIGAVAGLVLGFGFVVLLEALNAAVQRPVELARGLNITPIGTIPYIRTPSEKMRRQLTLGGLFFIVVLGLPAGLYAIDTYYEPLGLILAKLNTTLGL